MKHLVVGCGSIGKRHLRNLKLLSAGELIAYDTSPGRCAEVEEQYGVKVLPVFEEAMRYEPQVVLVCTPTSLHMDYALAAVRAGCHVLIEKPISHDMEGVNELIEIASSRNLVTFVGCNFRFHWGLRLAKELLDDGKIGRLLSMRSEFGQYLPDWHPWEDYRQGYSANKALGGGILLDAIHEVDYVYWMMGQVEAVACFAGRLGSLDIDTEDMAEILLRFKNGTIASIHMDYLQRAYNRSCALVGEEGTIHWSFQDNRVRLYSARDKDWQVFEQEDSRDVNEMYVAEMRHFLRCIRGEESPALDASEAKYELAIVLAARESSENGKVIYL